MLYDVAKVLLRVDDTVQILKAGAALKIGAATVTATPLVNRDATLGKTVCTAVKMNNGWMKPLVSTFSTGRCSRLPAPF